MPICRAKCRFVYIIECRLVSVPICPGADLSCLFSSYSWVKYIWIYSQCSKVFPHNGGRFFFHDCLAPVKSNFLNIAVTYSDNIFRVLRLSVLAVDDRHVAFCEYNGSVARIICVAVATLANEKLLERASYNDLLLCRSQLRIKRVIDNDLIDV